MGAHLLTNLETLINPSHKSTSVVNNKQHVLKICDNNGNNDFSILGEKKEQKQNVHFVLLWATLYIPGDGTWSSL